MHKLFINPIRIKGYGVWMGRIRTKMIKSTAKQLVDAYGDKFSVDFEKNKKVLNEMQITQDKLMRNKLAGYIVTLKKAT
jgi:small subunit ribosomal protein S17e